MRMRLPPPTNPRLDAVIALLASLVAIAVLYGAVALAEAVS